MLTEEQVDARNAGVVFVFLFIFVWTVCHILCLETVNRHCTFVMCLRMLRYACEKMCFTNRYDLLSLSTLTNQHVSPK